MNYFEKPPLMYWAVGGFRWIAFRPGRIVDARLTPALFGLGGMLLTYAAARRLYRARRGRSRRRCPGDVGLLYFVLSRILLLDMAVSVLMSATLFCFILGVREPPGARRRWLFYGLYASAALATLTKGLIGFLVPGAVMFLWLLVFNQWRRLRPLYLPSGIALFLADRRALARAGGACATPTWAHFYFVHEHWERFTTTAQHATAPFWYFIPVSCSGLFPWIGFLWPAVREAIARRLGATRGKRGRPGSSSPGWFSSFCFSPSRSRSSSPTSCRFSRRWRS